MQQPYTNNYFPIRVNTYNEYWLAEEDRKQVMYNEGNKYSFLKNKENHILSKMNNPLIRFWRFKDKFYYRDTPRSELIVGNKKTIVQEISSRFMINIHIVKDLNDVLINATKEIRVDTVYIAINSIPVVEEEIFDTTFVEDVFYSYQGSYFRNLFRGTPYLRYRFQNVYLRNNTGSFVKSFLNTITDSDNKEFIFNFIRSFFVNLNNQSHMLMLVDNKNVSEEIFFQKILIPIFGADHCITITEDILENLSFDKILKGKLFFHINSVPNDKRQREKLKKLLYYILVKKSIEVNNQIIPIYGQILITLDAPHRFFKEFLSSCSVVFINSLQKTMLHLRMEDLTALHNEIHNSLDIFAQESSRTELNQFNPKKYATDNNKYLEFLPDVNIKLNSQSILNTFNIDFANLLPVEERHKHTYITGMTGSGKSELLKVLIMGDMLRADGSVILLEPHGDLAQSVVKLIKDKARLIYINPFLSESKIPTINLFHLSNKSESNIARLTQVILNVLKSINSDESFTGAMEDILEMCIRVLLRKGNASFQELYRFLNDNRNEDLVQLGINSPNQLESEFFEDDFVSSKPTKDAVRRRLKKLLNDPVFSSLMNGENTIDLEQSINTKGKVIIFNIPKGKMPNTYKYYIKFIVEYIQILALKRADTPENDRVHTHLYIDEANNFITSTATIGEILTESRKYKLFVTFAHQAITQIKDTNLRDIMTTMTNVKIIGKNSNKTLEAMNKTLNTKLEDVEKLGTGEFYLSAGNNDIIKVNVTDKLLDGKEDISQLQEEEQKQYQLNYYYRSIEKIEDKVAHSEYLDQIYNEFICAIKSIDISYFDKINISPKLHEELLYNFNDESENTSGYISKQDLYQYFNLIYPEYAISSNKDLLKILKVKDDFFKQNVNSNKTYNGKKRFIIS